VLVSINAVALHWAWLVVGLAGNFGQVKCLTTKPAIQANSAFHPSGVGKWEPAIAGKVKACMANSDCGWMCGCVGKTVSLRTCALCNTWALLRWFHEEALYQMYVTSPLTIRLISSWLILPYLQGRQCLGCPKLRPYSRLAQCMSRCNQTSRKPLRGSCEP